LPNGFVFDEPDNTHFAMATEMYLGLVLIAVIRNDAAKAHEHYLTLSRHIHRQHVFDTLRDDRVLGLLARTFGDNDLARRHFEDSLSYCGTRGLRLEYAWTAYDFAELLSESPDPNDQIRCADLLDEITAFSQELGLRPLHQRSIALAQRLTPHATAGPPHPDGLTAREVEVIRLLAAGKTDRAIAETLSISVRTAGNHVRSILGKTGSANRTEAATYALRHGLT
jgi:DNA-binding CsgD family transcriptional regulator